MNVLYIVNSTYTLGGATKSFLALLDGLSQKGITPFVVVPDRNGIYKTLTNSGIKTLVLRYRHDTYPHLNSAKDVILFFPRLLIRRILANNAVHSITKFCKKENICIIHTNVSVISIGIKASQRLNIPHILHFREFADKDFNEHYYPSKKAFYKLINKSKTYSICITKEIQQYHGLLSPLSRVIYNGISMEKEYYNNKPKKPFFLFAGRLEPAKGLDVLLEAYRIYSERTDTAYKLLIAGEECDAEYVASLHGFSEKHHLSDRIDFLGPRKDIGTLMKDATAIIIASRAEAFGRCMAEAMLCGCLVIGHDTAGTKEQFDNGISHKGHEIGFRYNTTNELVSILLKVSSSHSDDFSSMRREAYETVKELYSTEAYIKQIYESYKKISRNSTNL